MNHTQTNEPLTLTDNPMWDELAQHVTPGKYSWGPKREIDFIAGVHRRDYCSRYAWTITAPETVAFVAEHLNGLAFDPLAGSGYWAYLLAQAGVEVLASDVAPPTFDRKRNEYHHNGQHVTVEQADAVETAGAAPEFLSLLLSWPPYDEPLGAQVLSAYRGDRVVYIGELAGGCCGDDEMFALLERDWNFMGEHEPVQWFGMHDYVQVFDRKVRALPEAVLVGEIVTPTLALPAGGAR